MNASTEKIGVVPPSTTEGPNTGNAEDESQEHEGISKNDLLRICLVGVAVVFCWLRIWEPFPRIDVLGLIAVVAGGHPIYREAVADILSRRMTMELSMTLALAAAPA
jgi:cation transport ATPase